MMIIIGCDLYLYRQQDIALWVGYDQIFPKQIKSQKPIRTLANLEKLDSLVWQTGWSSSFYDFDFLLDFLLSWSLDAE
jgi:hypothetical protein